MPIIKLKRMNEYKKDEILSKKQKKDVSDIPKEAGSSLTDSRYDIRLPVIPIERFDENYLPPSLLAKNANELSSIKKYVVMVDSGFSLEMDPSFNENNSDSDKKFELHDKKSQSDTKKASVNTKICYSFFFLK